MAAAMPLCRGWRAVIEKSSKERKPGLPFTIVIQLLGFVSFGTWIFTAMFAPMFFDGGNHWRVWALFLATLSAPVLVAIAMIALWIAYFKQWPRLSMISATLLVLSLLPLLGVFG